MNLNEKLKETLEEEIKEGYQNIEEDELMSSEVSLEDMELMSRHLQTQLKKESFEFPTQERYKKRLNQLFGIEFNGESTILYDQAIGEVEPQTVFMDSYEISTSIFLTNQNFITPPFRLPEIINYQKDYPYLITIEEEMTKELEIEKNETLILWRDMVGDKEEHQESIDNNIEYILKLNNYLFNGEKTHLNWLFEQNPFLEMLVSSYGYNDDIELVEKVINQRGVDENFYLDDLIWYKGAKKLYNLEEEPIYNGEFKIEDNTFIVIYNKLKGQKFHVPTQNVYLKALHRILVELAEEETLNQKEKEELKFYLVDFLSEFLLDSSNLESLTLV